MNIQPRISTVVAGRQPSTSGGTPDATFRRARKEAAFTMVEIAIALGIIAFALVAIIGILPTGLNTERENRERTLINQDGPYFLEAIRGGSQGIDQLTNYVDSITITTYSNTTILSTNIYTNSPGVSAPFVGDMTNGQWIVGLLTTPKFPLTPTAVLNTFSNKVEARVHALSGAAVTQSGSSRDLGFTYMLTTEVMPMDIHISPSDPSRIEINKRIATNLYDVRLNFKWPLLPTGKTGNDRKTFRTLVGGTLGQTNIAGTPLYFFQPQSFSRK